MFLKIKFEAIYLLQKANLNENLLWKVEKNYICKKIKLFVKMDRKIITFYDTEIEKYKFHQNKNSMSINYIDIKEIIVSKKFLFGKQKNSLVTKIIKKLDLYAYSFQKWVYIKDVLMKPNVCIL